MTTSIETLLSEHFGFDTFLPGQREVIEHLLDGASTAAVFPTGGGKSLCYQLPALTLEGITLVVSPLIALMKDQIDALTRRGIAAARLDSSLSAEEYGDVMRAARSGQLRLLYVAPERFNNERFRQAIGEMRVSLFAVDEAHCISEWGHNFRPDYLKLARFARDCGAERVLALTATATERVLVDICKRFRIDADQAVRTPFYRPNLTLLFSPVTWRERDTTLVARLRERPLGPTIVYVTLQRTAESVAKMLRAAEFEAQAYHAGMKPDVRVAVQETFMASERAIVVATIAFGMGIDKADIRGVYHYNPPKSLENYAQEIGRAGRDGQPADCQVLFSPDDLLPLENFVYGDTPSRDAIAGLMGDVFGRGPAFDVSYYQLSRRHDIRQLVVRTLLTYLEIEGFLEGGTPFYESYRFKPLLPSKDILANFDRRRREFLAGIFKQAKKARTWFQIDLDATSSALGVDRQRVVRALGHLAERNMLEVRTQGVRHRYRVRQRPDDMAALITSIDEKVRARESAEVARLRQVVALVAADQCQVSRLGAHFGQPLEENCGHCSWCLGGGVAVELPPRRQVDLDTGARTAAIDRAVALFESRGGDGSVAGEPRVVARFLCGLSSPALTRAKLTKQADFGVLREAAFPAVLTAVASRLAAQPEANATDEA